MGTHRVAGERRTLAANARADVERNFSQHASAPLAGNPRPPCQPLSERAGPGAAWTRRGTGSCFPRCRTGTMTAAGRLIPVPAEAAAQAVLRRPPTDGAAVTARAGDEPLRLMRARWLRRSRAVSTRQSASSGRAEAAGCRRRPAHAGGDPLRAVITTSEEAHPRALDLTAWRYPAYRHNLGLVVARRAGKATAWRAKRGSESTAAGRRSTRCLCRQPRRGSRS